MFEIQNYLYLKFKNSSRIGFPCKLRFFSSSNWGQSWWHYPSVSTFQDPWKWTQVQSWFQYGSLFFLPTLLKFFWGILQIQSILPNMGPQLGFRKETWFKHLFITNIPWDESWKYNLKNHLSRCNTAAPTRPASDRVCNKKVAMQELSFCLAR